MKKISKILYTVLLSIVCLATQAQTPQKVVMNFTQSPTTEMAFNWFTTSNTTGEQVQIATGIVTNPNLFTPFKTVNAATNQNIHKAVVTGLSPNTTYSFRVGKAGLWSEIGTFTTAKTGKEPFSFMYITDTQVYEYNIINNSWKDNVKAAFDTCPNVNFWLHCGDLSRENNYPGDLERVFPPLQNYFYKYPFAPVQGNHDNTANLFNRYFNLGAASFDSHGSTYTFIYGDAQFFAINSEKYNDATYISDVSAWMTANVNARPDIKWRIVYYHKVIHSGFNEISPTDGWHEWHDAMTPLFDALNIDIAFQGHTHVYEVIGPVKNKKLVPGAVTNVQQATKTFPKNVNGKLGGTFNVRKGTLYFTNGTFGDLWYPSVDSIHKLNGIHGIQDYASLFTGRLGSFYGVTSGTTSGFSNVSVSSDSIIISTYTAVNGVTTLFDKIKVVKHCIAPTAITINGATPWNTPKSIGDVTILPNATLTITANITASACSVITIENGGKLIVGSGGTIDGATIVAKSGSTCTIQGNGKILLEKHDDFDMQLGAMLNLDEGEVLVK